MQNVTKIPFFWLVTLWYPGGNIDKIYILTKSQGLVVAKPYYPPPFLRRKNIISLFILFFFYISRRKLHNERYNERRYKFYFFSLFRNFLLKCEKKQWKGKMIFFFKKGRGYRALQLQASVIETQWIEIADWWNRQ
jgi:hypothetical protein